MNKETAELISTIRKGVDIAGLAISDSAYSENEYLKEARLLLCQALAYIALFENEEKDND